MKLCEEVLDLESTEYWAKQWLYHRAGAEITSMKAGSGRLGVVKIGQAPSVLAYFPYTITLSMATRDTILMLGVGSGPWLVGW